ncbi:MAG: DUF4342 domain-containing protein [bacterium]|nr:DUF4342 domain-containing protein [bacterium]
MSSDPREDTPKETTWTQEIEIAADKLDARIRELIEEGNVRRIIIRNTEGQPLLEIPLTAGVAVGTLLTILTPVLAVIGALAAIVTRVRLEIVRVDDENTFGND